MCDIDQVPTPRASVIVPVASSLLTLLDGGVAYSGPCPTAQTHDGDGAHNIVIDRNAAKCGVCDTEFTGRIVRLQGRAVYLRLQF